jgi:putative transposase
MEKCYKFRIYPTLEQSVLIQKTFGCCRFVYNKYLDKRIKLYQTDRSPLDYNACSADMTALKRELAWLREVDATALQSALQNLDAAYKNFFRRVKQGGAPGFPKFKSKRAARKSYKSKAVGANIKVFCNSIQLPKLGLVESRVSQQIQGRILSATVSQNPSGKYFVAVCCTGVEIGPLLRTGATVGIDLGLKEFVVTSSGEKFENHKRLHKSEKKLSRLQRGLSRKQKGSANRNKARIKVAQAHERIANQRADSLHKLSTRLVRDYDVIALEDLQVKNMTRNHRLAKSIHDASWSEFARQLEYKCAWYGKKLVRVDSFYPSSQLCSMCGYRNAGTKDLAVRKWVCPECGAEHDRDLNAAKNILREGMRLIA